MSRYHPRVFGPHNLGLTGPPANSQNPWNSFYPSDTPGCLGDFSAYSNPLLFPACASAPYIQAQMQQNNAMPVFPYRHQGGSSLDTPKPLALVHPMPQALMGAPLSQVQQQTCESSTPVSSNSENRIHRVDCDDSAESSPSNPTSSEVQDAALRCETSTHARSHAGSSVVSSAQRLDDPAISQPSSPGTITPVSTPVVFQSLDAGALLDNQTGQVVNALRNPGTSKCPSATLCETADTQANSRKRSKMELRDMADCQMGDQAVIISITAHSSPPLGPLPHLVQSQSTFPANSGYSLHPFTRNSTFILDSHLASGEENPEPVSAQHAPVGRSQPMNPGTSNHATPSLIVSGNRGLRMLPGYPIIPPGAPLSYSSAQANGIPSATGFMAPTCILPSLYMEALSLTIWQFYTGIRQTKTKYAKKVHLRNALHMVVSGVFENAGLFIVGSSMNGFGSDQSDMDMCLTVTSRDLQQKREAFVILSQLLAPLRKCSFIRNLHLIRAKVPILKFRDTLTGVDCDLNVNNVVGIYNTHLLAMYTRIDWRVRPLGMFVKHWAQRMDIHDGSRGRLSTYPLLLMLIHYLQAACSPPVLPNLQAKFPKIFNYARPLSELDMRLELPWSELRSNNPASLADLFVGFIHYYTNEFDFTRWAVSVRHGAPLPIDVVIRRLPPHEQAHTARSFKVFVEEPFCQSNAARSLYDDNVLTRIRQAFVKTYQALRSQRPLDSIWVTSATDTS
ncbi:unnamed protein product [Dicrocoelium dendriticum]|nr:unnamed protein product [Dicrocoelium dendriticum]